MKGVRRLEEQLAAPIRAKAREIGCVFCAAGPGMPCRTRRGTAYPRSYLHADRVADAQEIVIARHTLDRRR